jgi:hypothetical protein
MKEQYVILKVVDGIEPIKSKREKIYFIASLVGLFTIPYTLNHFTGESNIFKIGSAIVFILTFFTGLRWGLSKKYKAIGTIELNEKEISGTVKGISFFISLKNTLAIDFSYEGYEGIQKNSYYQLLPERDLCHNYLRIISPEMESEYQVHFDNEMQFNILTRLIQIYNSYGIKAKTTNRD